MRYVPALMTAVSATVVCSVAHAQVLLTENYDDGLAASRWTFAARENGVNPALATPDGAVNFAFNYAGVNVESNNGPAGSFTLPIGVAPQGGGQIGVQIRVNDNSPGASTTTAITQAAIMPSSVNVTSNYSFKTDMYLNYNAPAAGSGSTESYLIGLNADGAGVVGDDLPVGGTIPANLSANGYAFTGSSDGDNNTDYRVYARRIAGDDGPLYSKVNASWTGTSRQPFINGEGVYTGVQILPGEANGTAAAPPAVPYRGFNNANTYYRDELFPNSQGYEVAGVVGKHWVTVEVEQHGKIALYKVNGKIINHLFLPTELTGKPSLGIIDQTAGQPNDVTDSYILFDNTSVTGLTASTANTIPAGATYVTFNGGGTQTADGAAIVNGITLDTAPTTLAGTGTLQLGTTTVANGDYGAIYSGGGAQAITKPVHIAADSAIYVGAATDTLTISSLTTNPNVDLHKVGSGKLTVPAGFESKSLTISRTGKMALSGAGGTKVKILAIELQPAITATIPLAATVGQLDFGRSVVAVDYLNAPSVATPAVPLTPFPQIRLFLENGFAQDGSGNPQWNGTGLITTAVEVQGAGFSDPANRFTVRLSEASALGYTDGAVWLGKTIDATTVLFGFTYKADSNLDQRVEFQDLIVLAQNYNATGLDVLTSWTKGDATGDGIVEFQDLVALAQVYNLSVSGLIGDPDAFAADWALAQSLVPEPTSVARLGLGGLIMGRRRR